MITPELLQTAVGCTAERAQLFAPHLDGACRHYGINTVERLAAFLAQVGHESGSFTWVREIADGRAYEGRRDLGNTEPGDGTRFRGRGLIQLTGRDNYRQMRDLLAHMGPPDFLSEPEALEEPKWAAWSAAAWWHSRNLSALADAGNFDAITRRINGGTNGATDRRQRWERAKFSLSSYTFSEPVQKAAETEHIQPEKPMPIPAIVAAVLPSLIEAIPKLGRVFGSGSAVSERNIKAAEMVVEAAVKATGAVNAQEASEKIRADPAMAQAASEAVEPVLQMIEAGGGGIEGARKADEATRKAGDLLHSASLWVAIMLLPIVYLLVLSLIGIVGSATWSDDVRAGLAGSLISAIIGAIVGYYYGQTTSRNRTPP